VTAKIISGTKVAAEIRQELKARVDSLKKRGTIPALVVVLVGEDPASVSYVTGKAKGAAEIGMYGETIRLAANASESELLTIVDKLNHDPKYHGILVQLPLPRHINTEKIISRISAEKDVDGFHPINMGKLLRGEPCPLPCTPHGVQELLVRSGNDPSGKHVVIWQVY
jgi:methylenetetrahydrofolate dehydrogenase (NADP+)/methenyltetrahydrofolate cyclohydrolase